MKELFKMLRQYGGEIMSMKAEDEDGQVLGIVVVAEGETAKVLARAADAISDGADPVPAS